MATIILSFMLFIIYASLMKRTLAALERDEREQLEDDLLRAQIVRDEVAENARRKEDKATAKYETLWKDHLAKWDEMGIVATMAREVTLPVATRPCALMCLFVSKCY